MSDDDFSFDFGAPETPPAEPVTPPVEAPPPTPAGPTLEEFTAMKKEVENAKKWQQDFQKMAGQVGVQPQAPTPQDRFTKFVQDPDGYENELLSKASQVALTQLQEMQAVDKIKSEFPELVPFENVLDWGALMQIAAPPLAQKLGRQPTFEEALRESATYFKNNLQGIGANPQLGQQREVLRLNAGGSPPPNNGVPDPFQMSDAEWGAFRRSNGY